MNSMRRHTTRHALKNLSASLLLCAGALVASAWSAEVPSLPDYVRLDLVLKSDEPAELGEYFADHALPLGMHLGYEPGKPPRQLWFTRPKTTVPIESLDGLTDKKLGQAKRRNERATESNRRHLMPFTVLERHFDVAKLSCGADKVSGSIGFATRMGESDARWVTGTLELDLTLTDGAVTGTFTRQLKLYSGGSVKKNPPKPKDVQEIPAESGTVSGKVFDAATLTARHAIAAGKDVTSYPGNTGGEGWPAYDGEIIEKPDDARLVWVSEGDTMCAWHMCITPTGGYTPPLIQNNRIYQYQYQPKPGGTPGHPVGANPGNKLSIEPRLEDGLKRYAAWMVKEAQEVVLCLDAATGATLWKRVFDFDGARNYDPFHLKSGPLNTPCLYDGKIFVQGTVGQLYCLDAMTGETLWEDGIAKNNQEMALSMICVDGVLLAAGKRWRLIGVDPATGKVLWEGGGGVSPGRGGGNVAPVPWTHQGKTYFLRTSGLYDPKTGKQLWAFPGADPKHGKARTTMNFPSIYGDIAFVRVADAKNRGKNVCKTLRAFRISPTGCEELWAHPQGAALCRYAHPCVLDGRVYTRTDNRSGGSSPKLQQGNCCTDIQSGELISWTKRGTLGEYCLGAVNGLIMGNASRFARPLPQEPYFEPWGDFGYKPNAALLPIYSDGRFFKRTMLGKLVCIDMRKER